MLNASIQISNFGRRRWTVFWETFHRAEAQVSINIGPPPVCLPRPRMHALPNGYQAPCRRGASTQETDGTVTPKTSTATKCATATKNNQSPSPELGMEAA